MLYGIRHYSSHDSFEFLMNILFYYIKTYAPINGGIANVSLWLAGHFVEMGHNVILLSRKPTTKAVSLL